MDKITSPCAACKYMRRKCTKECVLAPYYPGNKQENYAVVHKVFGASCVASLNNDIHPRQREIAMSSLAWEAQARLDDPVYGCCGILDRLYYEVKDLENQLAIAQKELSSYGIVSTFVPPPPVAYQPIHHNPMIPKMPNNDGCLTAQRFPSTQNAQMQQTQEMQTQHNVIKRYEPRPSNCRDST